MSNTMITECVTVKVFGQGINHNSPRVPDTSSPPFAHMIVGKVIISMKALHDCRTESPVCIAQRSSSRCLQKVNGLEACTTVCFSTSEWAQTEQSHLKVVLFKDSGKACPCTCSNSGLR